ncbi:MAG: peptidoglycan D,D-transpeptidase FtsI family protein [Thermoleophilia bacterium]
MTLVCLLLLGLLAARATFLGTVRAGDLSSLRTDNSERPETILAPRGSIESSDGADLAVDRLAVDVTASPNLIKDPAGDAVKLARALNMEAAPIEEALRTPGQYAVVAQDVAPGLADRARKLDLAGIFFKDDYQRFAPGDGRAAQVVGLTGADRAGLSGLEASENEVLTGVDGFRLEARDLFGRPIDVITDKEPIPGEDVVLTVDSRIQTKLQEVIAATMEQQRAKSVTALVMRPQDGAILGIGSTPDFNPNERRDLDPDAERVRAITDAFEPGSTFKVVTMAAALEQKTVTPRTSFVVPWQIQAYDRTLEDSHEHATQAMTVAQILAQSSNVGTFKVSQTLREDQPLSAWIKRFGFGQPTGIDYPGELAGSVLPPDQWSGTSQLNIPIGYGTSVTLMQVARAYAAVANGGSLITPHLIRSIGGERESLPAPHRIMSPSTASQLTQMLKGVVSDDGTASLAEVPGYVVAGKTGTAAKFLPDQGTYSDYLYSASFVGFAPADNPQLLIAVLVDEPTAGSYYAGDVAAPAFEQIANFSLQTLDILP